MGSRFVLAITDGDFKVVAASTAIAGLGKGSRSTTDLVGASRCSCSASAPASWRSVIDGQDWYAAVDINRQAHRCRRRADPAGRRIRRLAAHGVAQRHAVRAHRRRSCSSSSMPISARRRAPRPPTASIWKRTSASTWRWRAAAAACGTGTWCAARCTGRARCTTCSATRPATACCRSARSPTSSMPTTATCSTSPTGSCRARSTISTRCSACAMPTGQWVWMRVRAHVIDPEAAEIQLIGIAVDVTEQRHLALRSEAADMRLRTAIENTSNPSCCGTPPTGW